MCCCLLPGTEFCATWVSTPTPLFGFTPWLHSPQHSECSSQATLGLNPSTNHRNNLFPDSALLPQSLFSQRWLVYMCVHMMDFHVLLESEAGDLGHMAQKPYSSSSCLKKMNLWVLCMPNPSVPVCLKSSSQAHFCICFLEFLIKQGPNEQDLRQSPWPTQHLALSSELFKPSWNKAREPSESDSTVRCAPEKSTSSFLC